jgi:ABC-type transporter Mla subunit MlaD
MRRLVFLSLGILEFVACVLLAAIAWQLPGTAEVDEAVGRVEKVSRNAGQQVRNLRSHVSRVRARQPDLLTLSQRLEKQMKTVKGNLKGQRLDEKGLETASLALADLARGLDGVATVLDPKGIGQVGQGLGRTADYLDKKAVPAAEKAAEVLNKASASLKTDSGKLKDVLADTPAQLKAARGVSASLKRFEDGLNRMKKIARKDNLEAMDEGFKGLEKSLTTGAEQVDKVADLTIPRVTIKGLKLMVEDQEFWPDGKEIASGMRKAAKGCKAAQEEMVTLKKEMPRLHETIEESARLVRATRQALDLALSKEEELGPFLKALPGTLGKLIDELPAVLAELAKALRDTERLKETATALRQAQQGAETASKNWPEVSAGLKQSATLLRSARKQLKHALAQREEFEEAWQQTVELTTLFAAALPVLVEQLDEGLQQQESSLDDLGDSIEQASEALPAAGRSASRLLTMTRWLLCLVALMVGLHAAYLVLGTRLGEAYSGHAP